MLYLMIVAVNEYGSLDETRINAIARASLSHRAPRRRAKLVVIKALGGNSIYIDGLSAVAVNYLIDRLAVGSRRVAPIHSRRRLVRRTPEVSRMVRYFS